MNLAIIIGVSTYDHCDNLKACDNDIKVMNNVLLKLDKFDDICEIHDSPKAHDAKRQITEFVNKHKGNQVQELVFYFTGHGARFDDDFFYVFSDFSEKRKEVTGLRNTELDGLIRNLAPELTVKVVDACFSGSTYVKGEGDIKPILEKSAKQNELKNLYFLHSSSSDEESLATSEYSLFSLSFFKALTQNLGNIRHRDIMAYVADDMEQNGLPKPTFVVQADNTEIFGDISPELLQYINGVIGVSAADGDDDSKHNREGDADAKSFLQLVRAKSDEEYCTQEEGISNIKLLVDGIQDNAWASEITDVFTVEYMELEYNIPNEIEIGRWLKKNGAEKYFVIPTYKTETFSKQEYIPIPRKPLSKAYAGLIGSIAFGSLFGINHDEEVDYKLEKVEKTREILNGIEFTTSTPVKAFQVRFKPMFNSVENYVLTVVPVFSRKYLEVFSSIEVLSYTGWDSVSNPKCRGWKIKKILLKNDQEINKFCSERVASVTEFIIEDVCSKLK